MTPIGYVATALVAGLGPAIACHLLLKSAWRIFLLGAVTMTVAAVLGGFAGGLVADVVHTTAATGGVPGDRSEVQRGVLYLAVLTAVAGIVEEASRFAALRWLVGRPSPPFTLSDGLMFGTGFAGAEVVIRAGRAALQALAVTGSAFELSAFYPVAYVAIPIFHITLSVFLTHMLRRGRPSGAQAFVLLAVYHGVANASAMAALALGQREWAIMMWFLIAVVNTIIAIFLFRRSPPRPG